MTPTAPPARRPSAPLAERRRRRRGALSRLLTAPLPTAGLESRARRAGAILARAWPLLPLLVVTALLWAIWNGRTPVITPHHRPEALCFALAEQRFSPPMEVEPGAAVVRGRFSEQTPVGVAVREAMHFTEDMVIEETLRHVGDYDVDALWLRIPGGRGHWLVLAWMEAADLELTSFSFAGVETDLSPDETLWGNRLERRVLVPRYFHAGEVPMIALRGTAPRRFGPSSEEKE